MNKITALIWGLCLTGVTSLITLFSTIIPIKNINPLPFSDKIYRTSAYAVFSFILAGLLRSITNHNLSSVIMETVTIATLLGIIFEFMQFFVPKRTADVINACANIIGACIGATAFYIVYYLVYL